MPPRGADWRLRYGDVRAYDTQLGFSYLVARNLSPRDLASLGQCCVDWYDMCNDDYFRACLNTLFERVSRGATGATSHFMSLRESWGKRMIITDL